MLAGGLIYLTRVSIATAVQQAGAKEIERLKSDLAKGLENERQAFALKLESERRAFMQALEQDKTEATRALEAFKAGLALVAKRREVAEGVASFIDAYKRTPRAATVDQRRALEAAYYKIVLWVPSELVTLLTAMLAEGDHVKPDPKDLLIAARKAMLGSEAGPFAGRDLVHLADQA